VDPGLTLAGLNRIHEQFYEGIRQLAKDEAVFITAVETLVSENQRQVPSANQKSFTEALVDAEKIRRRFLTELSRAGGRSAKSDPLQKLIKELVANHPNITSRALLEELRKQERGPVIEEIAEEYIHFRVARSGTGRSGDECAQGDWSVRAPLSGLKHRLTRARKEVLSRQPARET
jgi:hypothetical protein